MHTNADQTNTYFGLDSTPYSDTEAIPSPSTLRTRAKALAKRMEELQRGAGMLDNESKNNKGQLRLFFPDSKHTPDKNTCTRPTDKWVCFRKKDHKGPCAAYSTDPDHLFYDPTFGGQTPAVWEPTRPVEKCGGEGPWDFFSGALGKPWHDPDEVPLMREDLDKLFAQDAAGFKRPAHGGYPETTAVRLQSTRLKVPEKLPPLEDEIFTKPKKPSRRLLCRLGWHDRLWEGREGTCKHCGDVVEEHFHA